MAKAYLVPSFIADSSSELVLPEDVKSIVHGLRYFAVENIRETRRFLRRVHKDFDIDASTFYILDKRTSTEDLDDMLNAMANGHDIGIVSDAGCPGVADPGSLLVDRVHQKGFRVVPLVGPSSILLALMASGLNGQQFTFLGYLPKEKMKRASFLKKIESKVMKNGETQIFMDTPYRNEYIVEDVLNNCLPNTKFTIACNLTGSDEFVVTKTVEEWTKSKIPSLAKKPCMFLLGK